MHSYYSNALEKFINDQDRQHKISIKAILDSFGCIEKLKLNYHLKPNPNKRLHLVQT